MNYYIEIKGRAFGPFSREQIDEKIAAGWLTRESKISYDGQNWQKAGEVGELFPNAQQSNFVAPTNSDVNANVNVNQTNQLREWYFSVDGKSGSGPYTADDIIAAFHSGKATLESLVWRNGEYARPIKNEPAFASLAPASNVQTNVSFTPDTSACVGSNRSNSSSSGDLQFARKINGRQFKAKFIGILTFCFGILTLVATLYIIFGGNLNALAELDEFRNDTFEGFGAIVGIRAYICAFGAFEILSLLYIIFQPMYLRSLWESIPADAARVKPVEAAGFLFIPFFNIYWIFVSLYGCVCDVNKALKQTGSELENRHLSVSEGVAMTCCVFLTPCLAFWYGSMFVPTICLLELFPLPPVLLWLAQMFFFIIALGFDAFYLSSKLKKAVVELNSRNQATN